MLLMATGVIMATAKFHNQWLAVEMDAMATRSLIGATLIQLAEFCERESSVLEQRVSSQVKLNANETASATTPSHRCLLDTQDWFAELVPSVYIPSVQ